MVLSFGLFRVGWPLLADCGSGVAGRSARATEVFAGAVLELVIVA